MVDWPVAQALAVGQEEASRLSEHEGVRVLPGDEVGASEGPRLRDCGRFGVPGERELGDLGLDLERRQGDVQGEQPVPCVFG